MILSPSQTALARQDIGIRYEPQLTERTLSLFANQAHFRSPAVAPKLSWSKFDQKQGLEAIYESSEGKQIYFRTTPNNGLYTLRISHYNSTQKVVEALVEVKNLNGQPKLMVAGVDFLELIKPSSNKRPPTNKDIVNLKRFMKSTEGQATMEGVAALFLALDPQDKNAVQLRIPLGLLRSTLELVTGQYQGIDQLEQLVTSTKLAQLKKNCGSVQKCQIAHEQFTVRESGFFDVLSKKRSKTSSKDKLASSVASCSASMSFSSSAMMMGAPAENENCGGECGRECYGLFGTHYYTLECRAHDKCVEKYGDGECFFSSPDECTDCGSFFGAAWSWFKCLLIRNCQTRPE